MLSRINIIKCLAFCGLLALAGWAIYSVSALTYMSVHEAETGTVRGASAVCHDSGASATESVRFGSQTCAEPAERYTNPVKLSTADPGVLRWNGKYYMVSTAGVPSFGIYTSDDLVDWRYSGRSVFDGTHPWGKDRFWAPEIHRVGDRFAVYYSASDSSGALRIGVATASSILGPYTDLGQPLVKESFWTIDVNFFRDDDGRQYVFWKEDGGETRFFGQEVDQSGTNFVGQRRVVMQKGLAWEGAKGIEAPWLTKYNGQYYMFYSGELFSSPAYATGVARSSSPLGQYDKKGDPILRSSNRWKGPGHNSVVRVNGNDYMVYHAWDRTAGVGDRVGLVDRISWQNGWPSVGNGVPSESNQQKPQ